MVSYAIWTDLNRIILTKARILTIDVQKFLFDVKIPK